MLCRFCEARLCKLSVYVPAFRSNGSGLAITIWRIYCVDIAHDDAEVFHGSWKNGKRSVLGNG
jgi:hypothetical protein